MFIVPDWSQIINSTSQNSDTLDVIFLPAGMYNCTLKYFSFSADSNTKIKALWVVDEGPHAGRPVWHTYDLGNSYKNENLKSILTIGRIAGLDFTQRNQLDNSVLSSAVGVRASLQVQARNEETDNPFNIAPYAYPLPTQAQPAQAQPEPVYNNNPSAKYQQPAPLPASGVGYPDIPYPE